MCKYFVLGVLYTIGIYDLLAVLNPGPLALTHKAHLNQLEKVWKQQEMVSTYLYFICGLINIKTLLCYRLGWRMQS